MLVAIISDIHNNIVNFKKVLNYCEHKKVKTIICCGDLASKEALDFLNDNFSGVIHYTFGNADYDDLQEIGLQKKYRQTFFYKNFGETTIEDKLVAFTHYPKMAKSLARTEKYTFVFYGHTHKPWEVMSGGCKLLNPGTAAGDEYAPTFAIWNTENDKFELIRVHELK